MHLFIRFPTVTFAAKHLAIGGDGSSALFPRRDVIGFRLLYLEMLATQFANAFLTFANLTFGITIKNADAQMMLIVVENIVKQATSTVEIKLFEIDSFEIRLFEIERNSRSNDIFYYLFLWINKRFFD